MQEASEKRTSGMIAVLGLDTSKIVAICEKVSSNNGMAQIANYNCPGQIVIAGDVRTLEEATELAEGANARKCIPLSVSGAFHSSLMKPAALRLQKVIKDFPISKPEIEFVANVTGDYISKPEQIKNTLISQVTSPVQWEASIRHMISNDVTTFVEVGPGKVLSGLVRRIDKNVTTLSIGTSDDVEKVLALF